MKPVIRQCNGTDFGKGMAHFVVNYPGPVFGAYIPREYTGINLIDCMKQAIKEFEESHEEESIDFGYDTKTDEVDTTNKYCVN